jgi:ABC-2 type transport system permease protein
VLGLAVLWAGMLAAEGAQSHQALVEETEIFVRTPAVRIFGVSSGVSVGATVLIRGFVVLAALAALMSVQAIVRHTRQSEETGRAELVRAAVVGRYAALAAALVATVGADIALAMALALAGLVTGSRRLALSRRARRSVPSASCSRASPR